MTSRIFTGDKAEIIHGYQNTKAGGERRVGSILTWVKELRKSGMTSNIDGRLESVHFIMLKMASFSHSHVGYVTWPVHR
jgi:hypothetical protein